MSQNSQISSGPWPDGVFSGSPLLAATLRLLLPVSRPVSGMSQSKSQLGPWAA